MKFSLFVGLLVFCGSAFCWPYEEDEPSFSPEYEGFGNIQQEEEPSFSPEYEGFGNIQQEEEPSFSPEYEGDGNFGNAQMDFQYPLEDEIIADTEEAYAQDEPPLPKDVADQLRKQFAQAGHGGMDDAMTEAKSTGRALRHGCTVALQMLQNNVWLGCAGGDCRGATCPRRFMRGGDWNNCWGEVFRMYRGVGTGNIRNGDVVGLYYPKQNTWFSMLEENKGKKSSCPGSPGRYGFQDLHRWFHCGGEVFIVFAEGRKLWEPIHDQDTISLYYPCGDSFVVFQNGGCSLSQCMGRKHAHGIAAPNEAKYDKCIFDSMEITIRPSD